MRWRLRVLFYAVANRLYLAAKQKKVTVGFTLWGEIQKRGEKLILKCTSGCCKATEHIETDDFALVAPAIEMIAALTNWIKVAMSASVPKKATANGSS